MTNIYDPEKYNRGAQETAVITFLSDDKVSEFRALPQNEREAFISANMTPAMRQFLDQHLIVDR
jgi:hypothetical protein